MAIINRTELINELYKVDDENIFGFFKEHRFLSNFHECEIEYDGIIFHSSEAAYQAAKTLDPEVRKLFIHYSPSQSKREGQKIKIREDWENIKNDEMYRIVWIKFSTNKELADLLIGTGERHLEETNYWNDKYWGADLKHQGENWLGKILMKVRYELRSRLPVLFTNIKNFYNTIYVPTEESTGFPKFRIYEKRSELRNDWAIDEKVKSLKDVFVYTKEELDEAFEKFNILKWLKLWAEGAPMPEDVREQLKENYKAIASILKVQNQNL